MFSPLLKQCFVTVAVSITTIGHGSQSGLPTVLLTQLHQLDGVNVTNEDISWLASIPSSSLVVGGFLVTPVMGKLGRKTAHLLVALTMFISWIIIALTNNFKVIIIGRILQGLSFGMMLPLRSVLVGEYTSPKNRGAFLATVALSQGAGVFFIHLIGTFFTWRATCYICAATQLISLIIIQFSPETPSWLADKEKFSKCKEAFRWLRGDKEEEELDKMIKARATLYSDDRISNIKDILNVISRKEFYKPIILIFHGYLMGEFSGASIMACYSSIAIPAIAGPNIDPNLCIIYLGVVRIITNVIAIYINKKVRRKPLIFSSAFVCILCYLIIALYMFLRRKEIFVYDGVWLPVLLMSIMYVSIVFVIGMPYIIAGEVFPIQYRSIAGSVSILGLAISNFTFIKTFPGLIEGIGFETTFLVYAGILVYGLIVVWTILPETKGKTLQEIEEELRGLRNLKLENDVNLLTNK